jgi:hypothetical protein
LLHYFIIVDNIGAAFSCRDVLDSSVIIPVSILRVEITEKWRYLSVG